MSEKALSLLAATTFAYGLTAGLPPGVRAAHKFGERILADPARMQLHDCGIVYAGNSPYLLCIMTQGPDQVALTGIMSDVSRLVYAEAVRGQAVR
jgi:hypothetical protein